MYGEFYIERVKYGTVCVGFYAASLIANVQLFWRIRLEET